MGGGGRRITTYIIPILKKKIGCYSKLDGKIWHSIFNWPIFGCNSQFLVALAYPQ